jgi:4-diphosphocytidyl-2-C-methyl-D-erythritol kinase
MKLERTPWGWKVLAPAKVNLSLCLQGRRDDGYHELETVMLALRFYDELQLEPADDGRIEFEVVGAEDIPTNESNLAIRALKALQVATGCSRGAKVQLTKRIPSQAGLGGGSSDAAAALVAGNRLWDLRLSHAQLSTIAATLGSDIPFFLPTPRFGARAAVCTGRGERVAPFSSGRSLPIVVVKPAVGLATSAVYANYSAASCVQSSPDRAKSAEITEVLCRGLLNSLGALMRNDLQAPALALCPELAAVKAGFDRLPVVAHQLSGSGSAYFAVCRSMRQAQQVAKLARERRWGESWAMLSC